MRHGLPHAGAEEIGLLQHGLVHNHLHPLGFQALHDALHAAGAEVVAAGLHDQAVNADNGGG